MTATTTAYPRSYGRAAASQSALGIARDSVEALTAKIRGGLDADMLLTSAGVSRGDYDVVKDVLAREGEIDFWTVRMRPGKPLAFGAFPSGGRRVPHIGFPGNPVSSMISFELFARPAIFKMMGRSAMGASHPARHRRGARSPTRRPPRIRAGGGERARRTLLRLAHRASGLGHPDVDGRRQRPGHRAGGRAAVEPGEEVTVMMLDWSARRG